MVDKIINLRIFDDENGVMNKSLLDVKGSILSISQFTLYADASKGRRPSYIKALGGDSASVLYNKFNQKSHFFNVFCLKIRQCFFIIFLFYKFLIFY